MMNDCVMKNVLFHRFLGFFSNKRSSAPSCHRLKIIINMLTLCCHHFKFTFLWTTKIVKLHHMINITLHIYIRPLLQFILYCVLLAMKTSMMGIVKLLQKNTNPGIFWAGIRISYQLFQPAPSGSTSNKSFQRPSISINLHIFWK